MDADHKPLLAAIWPPEGLTMGRVEANNLPAFAASRATAGTPFRRFEPRDGGQAQRDSGSATGIRESGLSGWSLLPY